MARTTTAHMFSAVNGVSESPDRFQFDAFGEAEGEIMGKALAGVTDVVIGRKLWQEWSEYWLSADANDPFAGFINPVRKHVISSSLSGELGWNSVLIDGDPVEYVQQLRERDGGGIIVAGGIETVRSLFLAGAIDALTLTMHPAITGDGRRLFDESVPLTRLRLIDSTMTPVGNAVLTYALRA
ncbi:MAG: dihydrofolate reductase family protein [Egibacteraceae bacterium]